MNLSKEYPTEIYVGTKMKRDFQPVKLDNKPDFCIGCKKMGHIFSSSGHNPDRIMVSWSNVRPELGRSKRNQTSRDVQQKAQRSNTKKVWKPKGKVFELKDVLTINDQADIPISRVFQQLKNDLIVVDKPDFLWDEDPKVRAMLASVFQEDGEEKGFDDILQTKIHEEVGGDGGDKVVADQEEGDEMEDQMFRQEDGSNGSVVQGDAWVISCDAQEDVVPTDLEANRGMIPMTGAGMEMGTKRHPSRPWKHAQLLHCGYVSDSGGMKRSISYGGPFTNSKSHTSGLCKTFDILSNEEDNLECQRSWESSHHQMVEVSC